MVRGSEEERRVAVLLEKVEQQYEILSEKVMSLDQKFDLGLYAVRSDVEMGFGDLRMGVQGLIKELREHTHAG